MGTQASTFTLGVGSANLWFTHCFRWLGGGLKPENHWLSLCKESDTTERLNWTESAVAAAAAAAKLLQLCPTLCDPTDGSPPGSAIPGILQARTLEWVAISFSNAKIKSAICKHTSPPSQTSLPSYSHPTSQGHHRASSWAPCAIQQIPTSYSYICQCCSRNSSHPPFASLCLLGQRIFLVLFKT